VLVIEGADVGLEGELACIDGSDDILKALNEDFKIGGSVLHLAKIAHIRFFTVAIGRVRNKRLTI
jgi:hypothetical protein